jgi:hypothetical protein
MKDRSQGLVVVTRYSNIRREASRRWTASEDQLFYQLLEQHGTDFSMFALHFPHRSKKQIKSKFIREARQHATLISNAIRGKRLFEAVILADDDSQSPPQPDPSSPCLSECC